MKTLIKVLGFYGLTFLLTIVLSIVQQAAGIDAGIIILPQFGPGLAAVVMLTLSRGGEPKIAVASARIPFAKYAAALGLPLIISVILFLLYGAIAGPISAPSLDAASFAVVLAGMLLGAFGEELGWRGYLQNLLEGRVNGFVAFLTVGVLWGVWHVGNYANGPLYMLFFILSTIGYSAALAWLLKGTGYNVLLACLFHSAVNAGFYLLKDALADVRLIALNGLIWIVVAGIVTAINRKDFLRFSKGNADAKP